MGATYSTKLILFDLITLIIYS